MKKYDAIIIGSGQAGTPLAFKLASNNQKVAFIEKEHLGGTCLNVGCTPTKTYVASARRMWDAKHGAELGIHIPDGAYVDLKQVKERKDSLIKKSVDGIAGSIEKNENIDLFRGTASFEGEKIIQINNEQITAPNVFINVGGRPLIPDGFEDVPYLTNESILNLEKIPEHLIIVGGSYIGLEFGQMFRRFGSKVTIIERNDRVIHREDPETSNRIHQALEEDGVAFRLSAQCLSGKLNADGSVSVTVNCALGGAPEVTGSHILLAVGRVPNTDTLNLDKAGVETSSRGHILVNDTLETNVPGIYALGDCNGKGAFTHTAYNDYEIVSENMLEGKSRKVSDRILTYGLFIDPPLGRAGMTLAEARATGKKLKVGHRTMDRISRAKEKGETKGYMSVVIDANTDKILGATVLGTGGDEIISSILNVMYADQPYTVIRDSVQPHPTVSELIPTMLESLRIEKHSNVYN